MNMNWLFNQCRRYRESLSLLAADCLPPGRRRELEEHLARCPQCREYVEEMTALANGMKAWRSTLPEVEPSAGFHDRLVRAIQGGEAPVVADWPSPESFRGWVQWLLGRPAWAGLATAWALILFFNLSAPRVSNVTEGTRPTPANLILTVLKADKQQWPEALGPTAPVPNTAAPAPPPGRRRSESGRPPTAECGFRTSFEINAA